VGGAQVEFKNSGGRDMNNEFLKRRLRRVIRRHQWLGLWRKLAIWWGISAVVGLAFVWVQHETGWVSPLLFPLLAAVSIAVASGIALKHFEKAPDYRWAAQKIEAANPELKGLLLTAVQQNILPGVEPSYLEHRVMQEAIARSQEQDWVKVVAPSRLAVAQVLHVAALVLFAFSLANIRISAPKPQKPGETLWVGADGISITPGDTSIERGESLVVLARFGKTLPPTVSLVVTETNAAARTIPLVKSLADPVFGGSVPEVASDLTYRLEYRGQKTREFKVSVFEHPRLVRADADLVYPDYTKLPPKHIEDTRRVSAVEGSKLDYALQLNKPVKSARLVARDGKKTAINLTVTPDKAVATLPPMVLAKTQTYDLQLVDAEGRANKTVVPFVIDVQPNRPPELRLVLPRGDVRPSALEEIAFEATVFDDFGAPAYGIAYSMAGGEPKYIELGKDTAAKEKRSFTYMLKLEDIGAKPDDLISWHAWADDIGPDGKLRRTSSDLFFGEVRPFDEIFRESQGMESDQQQAQGGGQGAQTRKLVELQKQVINATWRLQRDGPSPKYADDAKTVAESQQQALAQAEEAMEEARSPRAQALWTGAISEMKKAIEELNKASKSPASLAKALPAEQAAYQALLKLQARETNVSRSKRGGGGGGGGQQNQRQLDQLDLAQSENRYETQRQAQAPTSKERTEQLQVMNRLQELARRQQDVNERLKELQASLQEAKTEQEREELKRRLKRLQEEQREMLSDVDELRQRMDRPENQSRMAEERKQLEQTRDDIQKASDAAAQGSVAQALASGTRAQRQLQELREEIRKQNSSQFAEDMRDMRQEARDLAREQEKISQQLEGLSGPQTRKSLSDSTDRKALLDEMSQQKERMNKFTERAQQLSEQAENAEPLLSRQLYDSVRKLSQEDTNTVKETKQELIRDGMLSREMLERMNKTAEREAGGKSLDLAKDMMEEGFLPQASSAGRRARAATDELRRGVERAAESVLGDDAEQLKLAQSELDKLTDELTREIAQAQGQGKEGQSGAPQPGGKQGDRAQRQASNQAGQQPGQSGQPGEQGQTLGEPGQGEQPGQEPGANGQPGQGQGERRVAQRGGKAGKQGQSPGQAPGDEPGQSSQPGQPGQAGQQGAGGQGQPGQENQSVAEGSAGQGGQPGSSQTPEEQVRRSVERQRAERMANSRGGQNQGGNQQGGGDRGGFNINDILNGVSGGDERVGRDGDIGGMYRGGPFVGGNFAPWNDRLRDVEQLLDSPDLRNAVATARERARLLRRDMQQERKKPDWAVVQLQILKPLVEVRARVAEELSRRDSKESLAPIDRDPVPPRYAESVRRYYEELGKDKPDSR
jgi:hypothetical protein